jgi:tetratricopeptide (TPR) repeat protein
MDSFSAALADFNKVIALDSNYAGAYFERGDIKHELEDFKGALAYLKNSILLDSTHAEVSRINTIKISTKRAIYYFNIL